MRKDWSEKNKQMQCLLGKRDTFEEGIRALLALRDTLFDEMLLIARSCPEEALSQVPFPNASGYHCKTIAYSLWHIFRIEDIVAHTLIRKDAQILFDHGFDSAIRAPIVTTGNELSSAALRDFSAALCVPALLSYCEAVKAATDTLLQSLSFSDLKTACAPEDKRRLLDSGCVSSDENAAWLIEYWCGKDILGLIKMPFSRHWIMHTEAMLRIYDKLVRDARKGQDMVAPCGLSCAHCFLKDRCGSCRSAFNRCSFAAESEGGGCPNAVCCREKGLDGCWQCDRLPRCEKGFYTPTCSGANAAKAQCLYILRHGKKDFLRLQDDLHERFAFQKVQEVLGQDIEKAYEILEDTEKRLKS